MAESNETKRQEYKARRRSSKAKFTRKFNEITKAIENESKSPEVIRQLFDEVKIAWTDVESKHEDYCSFLEDEECDDEEIWISEIYERYVNAMEMNTEYEKSLKTQEDEHNQKVQQREEHENRSSQIRKVIEKEKI